MSELRANIIGVIHEVAQIRESKIVEDLNDETILLESGLDSLGFAILVALLEERLGYDPFVLMDTPIYPRSLAEFIQIYQKFDPK